MTRNAELPNAEQLAIGLPIYAGTAPRPAVRWLEDKRDSLLERTVYLFVSCLSEGSKAEAQLADGVPSWLVAHASQTIFVGGQVRPGELGFFERVLMKQIAGIDSDVDRLNDQAISELKALFTSSLT
jgi:menaquinone-dependent protoporphyrinogen oxidase